MQWLFIAIVVIGLSYFVGIGRRVDAFLVAFVSAVIYFLPGIVGYTLSPTSPRSPIKLPVALEPEAIAIMLVVTVLILLGGVLWDQWDRRRPAPHWVLEDSRLSPLVALVLSVIGIVLTVAESGGTVFTAEKTEIMKVLGRGHLLWQMGATLSVVLAFVYHQRLLGLAGWLLLVLDLWIGYRYAFATTFIATALLWIFRVEPYRLGLRRLRYWVVFLVGGLAIVSYQNIKGPLRDGDWPEIGERVSNPLWYAKGVLTSEPFTTQTVLNEIVRMDFRTGTDHLQSAAYHLVPFAPALGEEAVRFNRLYQPALFPLVDHGLAGNIWAQMWSSGDWLLLLTFLVVFLAGLAVLSRLLRSTDPAVRAYAAVAIAYWAFYIHRNELQGVVGSQKVLILVWVVCVSVSIAVATIARGSLAHGRPGVVNDP